MKKVTVLKTVGYATSVAAGVVFAGVTWVALVKHEEALSGVDNDLRKVNNHFGDFLGWFRQLAEFAEWSADELNSQGETLEELRERVEKVAKASVAASAYGSEAKNTSNLTEARVGSLDQRVGTLDADVELLSKEVVLFTKDLSRYEEQAQGFDNLVGKVTELGSRVAVLEGNWHE